MNLDDAIKELEEKAKQAEENFFINDFDLSKFPTINDITNESVKEEVIEWIPKIVWYILKKDGKLVTLTQHEQDLIESLSEKENANYNKINKELQKSFEKNKGKSIKEYMYEKDFYGENYNNEQDDYKKNAGHKIDFIPDLRVNDIIDKLQLLLFGNNGRKGFFEVFYDEYGEICNAQEEFINFCKKLIRENIFVNRTVNRKKYELFLQGQDTDFQQEEQKTSKEVIEKNMDNKLIKFLKENRTEINNAILKELLQDNSFSKTEEIKKALIVFYIDFKNLIYSDSSKSPSDMKVFTLLTKYFEEQEIKQMRKEIKNDSSKQKQKWIEKQLDGSLSFWKTFSDKCKEDINNIDYEKESKRIKEKNESRVKENIIQKMKDIIVNYSISNDVVISKNEIEIILTLLRRLLLKTGGNLTKLEINKVASRIYNYTPCEKYKEYIIYSVFGRIKKENEIEEHIKNCDNCKRYKEYISESKTAREKRNKNVLKIINSNPYIDENKKILTEDEYIKQADITYFKKQFRNNPCETNFYYLVSAYIKNGNKEHAKELLEEGFNLYKENVFMKETLIYLQEEN